MNCDLWSQHIQVLKLFKGRNYSRKYGMYVQDIFFCFNKCNLFPIVGYSIQSTLPFFLLEIMINFSSVSLVNIKFLFWCVKIKMAKNQPTQRNYCIFSQNRMKSAESIFNVKNHLNLSVNYFHFKICIHYVRGKTVVDILILTLFS